MSGAFSGFGVPALVLEFLNGFELAEGLAVAGTMQGFFGADQSVGGGAGTGPRSKP